MPNCQFACQANASAGRWLGGLSLAELSAVDSAVVHYQICVTTRFYQYMNPEVLVEIPSSTVMSHPRDLSEWGCLSCKSTLIINLHVIRGTCDYKSLTVEYM